VRARKEQEMSKQRANARGAKSVIKVLEPVMNHPIKGLSISVKRRAHTCVCVCVYVCAYVCVFARVCACICIYENGWMAADVYKS
jgi:hypothetical protein